jgi:hypothetical protein
MGNCFANSMATLALACIALVPAAAQVARAQARQQPPRQGGDSSAKSASPTQNEKFNPRDFSGIWLVQQKTNFTMTPGYVSPPMTPWAQARYDAAKPGIGPRTQPLGNDPIMKCDPIGFPRVLFDGLYPLEILQTSDRIVQFFDFFYAYRTIWTDGRPLPNDDDLDPRWYGYSVGKWEGNTLVVSSKGFDDRSWLDWDGHPHSSDMQLEERYRRVDHDTIEVVLTVTDPKAYTKPWVSETKTLKWSPKETMREDVCSPSDEQEFYQGIRNPAGNAHPN